MIEPGAAGARTSRCSTRTARGLAVRPRGPDGRAGLLPGRLQPGLHRPAERLPGGRSASSRSGARSLSASRSTRAFCHKAFQEHLGITIPLLADFHPKGEVARRYGVYIEERGHDNRALVMIGPDGKVAWSLPVATPLEVPGANLIFDALEQLARAA